MCTEHFMRLYHQDKFSKSDSGKIGKAAQELGLSLAEVLVAITLLMIMIVPAMNALTEGVLASRIHGDQASAARKVQNKMEEILARSFYKLDTDTYTVNNTNPVAVTFPLAVPSASPSLMDDSGYSDTDFDVYIFRCKNNAGAMVYDPPPNQTKRLCIQIKPKGESRVVLQTIKT